MRSRSSGFFPAISRARIAAIAPRLEFCSAGFPRVTIRLSAIPVRSRIHSSLVATILARSSLVRRFSGKAEPVPVILEANGVEAERGAEAAGAVVLVKVIPFVAGYKSLDR